MKHECRLDHDAVTSSGSDAAPLASSAEEAAEQREAPAAPAHRDPAASEVEQDQPAETTTEAFAAPPDDHGAHLLELAKRRDPQDNEQTHLPPDEHISLRSVTVVEMYASRSVESLKSALAQIAWFNFDVPITDSISEAQTGYMYKSGVFWLVSESKRLFPLTGHGCVELPVGVDRVYGGYYALGPALVAMVLTFVLATDESEKLDAALRNDAESGIEELVPRKHRIWDVRGAKSQRVRGVHEGIQRRCLDWVRENLPGTLSEMTDGLGPPTCTLLSLTKAKPFETSDAYMTLLGLATGLPAQRFVSPDFLYLFYPVGVGPNSRMIGVFNEEDAVEAGWVSDPSSAPERLHESISSLMIADGMYALLFSYEDKLRGVRRIFDGIDFDQRSGSEVIALRDRLLAISKDISSVCNDVTVVVDEPVVIWAELYPLVPVKDEGDPRPSEGTAESKKRWLRAAITNLESHEANLRELILVSSTSVSESRSIDLQSTVTELTNKLRGLTIVLLILTVVLVGVGVATLLVQIFHVPVVHVPPSPVPRVPVR